MLPDKYANRIDVGDCWHWTGTRDRRGYGRLSNPHRSSLAHRAIYEILVAAIPDGLTLDHLCRNHGCVNPDHLEPVTQAENVRRGLAGITTRARCQAITHCPRGHPYDDANTWRDRHGWRHCRKCLARQMRDKKARWKARTAA